LARFGHGAKSDLVMRTKAEVERHLGMDRRQSAALTREVRLVVSNVSDRKERWSLEGAIDLAASLGSLVLVMVMVMEMVLMMLNVRLCTWNCANRECNSGDGGQNESKLPHKNAPWTGFL
jgi:hypothetical protein